MLLGADLYASIVLKGFKDSQQRKISKIGWIIFGGGKGSKYSSEDSFLGRG